MTDVDSAIAPTVRQRWRAGRWVISALVLITAVAALTTSLTAARPGGRMDPAATSPEGAHALIALLRDHGVDVGQALLGVSEHLRRRACDVL